jgi:hypothetical protein
MAMPKHAADRGVSTLIAAKAAEVTAHVSAARDRTQRHQLAATAFDVIAGLDEFAVVSIVGGRGSGKTTVLRHALSQIDRTKRFCILPLIRPELFGPAETLLSAVVGSLSIVLKDTLSFTMSARRDGEELTLAGWTDRILRKAILASTTSFDPAQFRIDQFVSEADIAVRTAAGFFGDWRDFIAAACSALDVESIIVPIDDADLASGRVLEVLQNIRMICSTPGVICVVGLDLVEARMLLAN